MKVANIIVAHKNPDQLFRLINQFNGEQFHNFIHIDRRCNIKDYANIVNHPHVSLVPKREKLVYAGYGFTSVTLSALYQIKARKERFFYFNLMSGMDFPLKPTNEFYDFLKTSYHADPKEFFEILDLSVWPGAHRYKRYHLNNWTIRGRYFTERIINSFIPTRKFYDGIFVPYGRSAWFTATDHFIDYSLKYIEDHPRFLQFLKTVWSPDEFMFNTLVMNSPFKDKIAPYLRHIDWSEGKVSPKVFRQEDLNVLLNSGCFLARKFDESIDKSIIDNLESLLTKTA